MAVGEGQSGGGHQLLDAAAFQYTAWNARYLGSSFCLTLGHCKGEHPHTGFGFLIDSKAIELSINALTLSLRCAIVTRLPQKRNSTVWSDYFLPPKVEEILHVHNEL